MKYRFLTIAFLACIMATVSVSTATAQSKDELNELLNSETDKKGKSKPKAEKTKPAAEEKTTAPKAEKEKPAKEEKASTPKEEKAKEPKAEKQPKEEIAKESEPKVEKQKPAKAEKAPKTKSSNSASGEKLRELPDPKAIGWRKNKKLGDKLFAMGGTYNGLRYYEEALAKKPKKTFINQKLADGNFALRDYASANKYYKILADLDSVKLKNLPALYQYALTEKYLGRYENAKVGFEKFNRLAKSDDFSDYRKNSSREAQGCDLAMQLMASRDMPEFKVEHLNESINQPLTDYAPVLKNANTLYYGAWTSDSVTMENKREKYAVFSRIYSAQRSGAGWSQGQPISSEINNVNAHTGNPAFTPDGKTMFYTQCLQDDAGVMRCNIYKSTLNGDTWSSGEKMDAKVNKEGVHSTQPAVGRNEAGDLVLYFVSNANPARGLDIYSAKLNSNGTTEAAKALSAINTRGDEMTPYFDFSSNTLYFSSNGQLNIGGADVYKTTLSRGEWSTPVHMGLPINSSVDDMYFSWNEKTGEGFVVSNRVGGFGVKSANCCDDIYTVSKTKLYFAVKGLLQNADANYQTIKDGLVQLYDEKQGKEIKASYATDGGYFFDLEKEKSYRMIARKKGFEDMLLSVSTIGKRSSDTVTLDFTMKSIPEKLSRVGETIGVVYWEFNKDNLMKGAPDTLNKVTDFMTSNPQYVLEVGSHTDGKGIEEYNMALSQRRSDAVLKYLLSKKIRKFRLVSKAYGESMPIALNEDPAGVDNPAGRDKNRRTEFKVISEMSPDEITAAEAAEDKAKETKPAAKSKK